MRRFKRKRAIVALSVVAALAVAGGAYAYLSTSGSGSGSGAVTASNSTMVLTASGSATDSTAAVASLAKLDSSSTFYIWAAQSTNPQETATVTTTVTPTAATGCPAGSFTLGSATGGNTHQTSTAVQVPAGSGKTNIGSDTVYFNNIATADQTACEQGYSLGFATP